MTIIFRNAKGGERQYIIHEWNELSPKQKSDLVLKLMTPPDNIIDLQSYVRADLQSFSRAT